MISQTPPRGKRRKMHGRPPAMEAIPRYICKNFKVRKGVNLARIFCKNGEKWKCFPFKIVKIPT
jgi:hypothetical protein